MEILENTRQAWARIINRYIKKLQKENKELKRGMSIENAYNIAMVLGLDIKEFIEEMMK